jgi:hypothetical protein
MGSLLDFAPGQPSWTFLELAVMQFHVALMVRSCNRTSRLPIEGLLSVLSPLLSQQGNQTVLHWARPLGR